MRVTVRANVSRSAQLAQSVCHTSPQRPDVLLYLVAIRIWTAIEMHVARPAPYINPLVWNGTASW